MLVIPAGQLYSINAVRIIMEHQDTPRDDDAFGDRSETPDSALEATSYYAAATSPRRDRPLRASTDRPDNRDSNISDCRDISHTTQPTDPRDESTYLGGAIPVRDQSVVSAAPVTATNTTASSESRYTNSSTDTAVPSPPAEHSDNGISATTAAGAAAAGMERKDSRFEELKAAPTNTSFGAMDKENISHTESSKYIEPEKRPGLGQRGSSIKTEQDLFAVLSRRRTSASGKSDDDVAEEHAEIERLMSRLFGQNRQEHSQDEKTRHTGVVFRNLTVLGVGLGAMLQPTVGDVFLGLPRFFSKLFTKGPKAAFAKPPVREILSDFTGCIRPGEMCLVLGRPGSGCSTFLKVLGNQRGGFEEVKGDVTYGGTDAKQMAKNFRGEVLYNPEDDLHYATLTVKNTLTFALQTRTPGKESRNEGESKKAYVQEFLRVVTKLFWIEHTLGTKVGNEMVRGVSGGEKKRVSIAEAMITKASVQAWDNSTRGLDASTALEYVQSIRSLTNMANISTAVALYQAGETLYDSFDKVLLIDEGKCLYFGAADDAKHYFQDLGFVSQDRWTTADFLTSVTDEHEREIKKGWENRVPRSTAQFAEAYRKSEIYQRNLADISQFEANLEGQRRERLDNRSKKTDKKNYTISFPQQVWACTKRQGLIVWGDKAALIGKWGGIVGQSLIVGSLFYNIPDTSQGTFTRGGTIFFLLLFNALLALAELTAAFESRPIMLKHKSFSFYRPSAFAVAQTVLDIPLVFMQVFLFDLVIYFMAGLAQTASQFFISIFVLWLCTMTMYAFFRSVGALAGSLDNATKVTGIAIQAIIVYTGYLIPPTKMHPWFKWLIWINPIQYGFECLMSNEFYNLELRCVPPNLVPQGPLASPQYQSCTLAGSQPGQTMVNGANYIKASFNYTRAHLWRNVGFICAFFLFFVVLTMIGMELAQPNAGGAASTVFKRGQIPAAVEEEIATGGHAAEKESDEESGEKLALPTAGRTNSRGDLELARTKSMKGIAKNETIFTYQNINYVIPYQKGERKLLSDVQGYVRPGKLTALMGASGAGKTTLLNTLAQRTTFGTVTGDFLVDGRPLPASFQRGTGFAEQMDVHEPTATVREALQFSALLRQPKEVPVAEKYDYCERIIDLLEVRDIAGATIGKIGEGLNQEQRKRVTIGVELASKPELLLFLDEPTSGLDSGAAFNIVRFLRKLADAGQAILCTIHQPSSVLFEQFDELLLLKSGGRVVYHGSLGNDSRILIDYFEGNGARQCPPKANPAEYMLEAIGAGNPDYKGKDWGDIWASSKEHEQRTREIARMIEERSHAELSKNLKDDRRYAMPLMTQTLAVIHRDFTAYWRTPQYIIGKFMLHIITGLFNTFTFYHVGYSTIDYQSRLFSIFMTLTISPPLIQQLQPKFLEFRGIFKSRENNSKIYSWFAFTTGAIAVEIPYSLLAGSIYFCTWWFGAVGRGVSSFASGYTYLMVLLFELYYVSFGQAIASFSPNELLASLLVPTFFLFVVSFCGVVAPYAALPHFWRWMYWYVPFLRLCLYCHANFLCSRLTPFHYLMEGFLGVAVHDRPVSCPARSVGGAASSLRSLPPTCRSSNVYG